MRARFSRVRDIATDLPDKGQVNVRHDMHYAKARRSEARKANRVHVAEA